MADRVPNAATTVSETKDLYILSGQIKRLTDWLSRFPFASFQILTGVALTTSAATIVHSLRRPPIGYLVIARSANAVVYGNAFTSQNLTLTASASVTVSLLVF